MVTSLKLLTLLFTLQKAREEIGDAVTLCCVGIGSASASSSTEEAGEEVINLASGSTLLSSGGSGISALSVGIGISIGALTLLLASSGRGCAVGSSSIGTSSLRGLLSSLLSRLCVGSVSGGRSCSIGSSGVGAGSYKRASVALFGKKDKLRTRT